MRISNNFNQNQSFKAIQVSDRVESVIDELLEEESGFKKSFKKLETMSNDNDVDVFIQRTKNDDVFNFQAIYPYTHETLCYLSGDKNPKKAAKNAIDGFIKFIEDSKQTQRTKLASTASRDGTISEDSAVAKIFKFLGSFV